VKGIVRTLLGFVCLIIYAQVCPAQVELCTPADGDNGSRLCVTLGFRDGKLVIDRSLSSLNASVQFTQRLTASTPDQVRTMFFDQLDRRLADRKKPYQLALTPDEQTKDAAGQLSDQPTAELRAFSGSWQAYRQKFEAWAAAVPGRKSFVDIFGDDATTGSGVYAPLTTVDTDLALVFNDNSFGQGFDLNTANFSFTVIDPVSDWNQVDIRLPGVSNPKQNAARLARIRNKLGPLRGQIWSPVAIRAVILKYYRQLNLVATVTVSSVTSGLSITVLEGARIARILLPLPGDTAAATYNTDVDKILYVLLSDEDFRVFIDRRKQIMPANPADINDVLNRKVIDYATIFGHDGPYLDSSRIQVQQLLLSQIGYLVSISDAEGSDLTRRNLVLDVKKVSDTPEAPPQTPQSAPPTATSENVVTGHQQEANEQTDFAPRNAPKNEKPAATLKEKKNYIGGGLEYRPGQGIRLFGLAQRSHLMFPFAGGSLSATAGVESGGIGSVNYFADYILFGRLHRRLSLQLNIGFDSDPQRMLASEVDERRNGGSGRLEFEPFRDRRGSLLRFYAEGRRATVALNENDTIKTKVNLTTLDVGSLFLFESVEAEYPRRIRLEPRIRFGLRIGDNSPSFRKITATGNFHQSLPRRLAADITGSLALASRNTPFFELPSFGGAEVVRGFRHDDALGRRLWSLQNELWLPLPNTATEAEAGLKTFLRDNVRLAPFVDIGGLYSPRTSVAGVRTGYGLGLRVIYNVIILKVDYAYGVGAAATSGGRGKFYFSIGTNLPL
jgi:hypothetical protein